MSFPSTFGSGSSSFQAANIVRISVPSLGYDFRSSAFPSVSMPSLAFNSNGGTSIEDIEAAKREQTTRAAKWAIGGASFCLVCCIVFVLIMVLALNIAELVVASKYENGTECNHDQLMSPVFWLKWDGIIGFLTVGMLLLTLGCTLLLGVGGMYAGACCLIAPAVCVQVAWTIIGAVVLWRDNSQLNNCNPQELHDMLWAAVLIHIILFGSK